MFLDDWAPVCDVFAFSFNGNRISPARTPSKPDTSQSRRNSLHLHILRVPHPHWTEEIQPNLGQSNERVSQFPREPVSVCETMTHPSQRVTNDALASLRGFQICMHHSVATSFGQPTIIMSVHIQLVHTIQQTTETTGFSDSTGTLYWSTPCYTVYTTYLVLTHQVK